MYQVHKMNWRQLISSSKSKWSSPISDLILLAEFSYVSESAEAALKMKDPASVSEREASEDRDIIGRNNNIDNNNLNTPQL